MPGSEIDDIFAKKVLPLKGTKDAQPGSQEAAKTKKKKKKAKSELLSTEPPNRTSQDAKEDETTSTKAQGKKRKQPVPEEIIDPSAPVKRRKLDEVSVKKTLKKSKEAGLQKFTDSRGSSGRQCCFSPQSHLN